MSGSRYQEVPDTDPQVLRQVVIPNPITVHLGSPDAAATNVQVSFPNYVKNVASSEIYPTWPDASLRVLFPRFHSLSSDKFFSLCHL